jgi:cobalamin-dependent methionine synthase I
VSAHEPPDSASFQQLEQLVRHLGEELTGFRRRALAAEARVRVLESALASGGDAASLERLRTLEAENADLNARVVYATERTRQLLARVHFLRQQQSRPLSPAVAPGAAASASTVGASGVGGGRS